MTTRHAIFTLLFTSSFLGWAEAEQPSFTAEDIFDPAHLLDIQIELPKTDWDAIRLQTRSLGESLGKTLAESPFTYGKGNVTINGLLIRDVGIRKKGFLGSLDEVRPSLKIKFEEYKKQNPVPGLDRLTLNNNKQDHSRLSQYLSYRLFRKSGAPASRCNFAKVSVNGTYLGVYSNVEAIKKAFLKRAFDDDSGDLFEGTVTDFHTDWIQRFEPKNKKAEVSELQTLAAILGQEELNIGELEKHLNIDAFVKFWATESLIGFWDGYTNNHNNFFIYRKPEDSKIYFIPWGTDSAFTDDVPIPLYRIKNRSVHSQSVLANRLYRHPPIQELYRATLLELMEKHWDEVEMIAEIKRVQALLRDHIYPGNTKFSRSVAKTRSFIRTRRQRLMKELDAWPIPLENTFRKPVYFKQAGHALASFETQWHARSPDEPQNLGRAELTMNLNGQALSFRQLGVVAEPGKDRTSSGERPPAIVFTGVRESNGKRIVLATGLSKERFKPTDEPVRVHGILIEGGTLGFLAKAIFKPTGLTMIDGTATFQQAAMNPGASVQGNMELNLIKLSTGESSLPAKKQ